MKKRMNAGRRRGRIGMAWLHQDAGYLVKLKKFDVWLDDYLAEQKKDMDYVLNNALPALASVNPGLGLATRLALELNPLFGVEIRSPFSVGLGLRHHTAEITLSKEGEEQERRREVRVREAFGVPRGVGVPAFMAPRDNGHRLSREDRARYDELSVENTYVPPERKESRYGAPEWPGGTELVEGRHPDAGEWGKLCYRTACQAPNAFYWNIGSRKHYCQECADIINREGMGGDRLLFLSEKEGEHA